MRVAASATIPERALPPRRQQAGFLPLVVASTVVHVGVFGAAVALANLNPQPRADLTALPVELVSLGKPRDPKLLPRKVRRRASKTPEAPAVSPPKADAVALDGKTKSDKKSRTDQKSRTPKKPRKLSAAAEALLAGGGDPDLDDALAKLEDPEGRPDGSRLGTTTDPAHAANAYEAQVAALLRARYKLPLTIPSSQRRFLAAELVLYIDRNGRVTRHVFTKRHPNAAFMGALENLLRSVQLPPPPRALAAGYAREGLAVRFKPD